MPSSLPVGSALRDMEKELLDACVSAEKAAAGGGGPADVDRCLDALRRLRNMPVTTKLLLDTQVPKRLRCLIKHPQEKIHVSTSKLLKHWKNVVIEELSKDGKKDLISRDKSSIKVKVKTESSETVKAEKVSKSGFVKVDGISRSKSLKVEKNVDTSKSKTVKFEKTEFGMQVNGSDTMMALTMMKCNNPARDKIRELLAEAFSRVPKETTESNKQDVRNIRDEVYACDPVRVAIAVESNMFEQLGPFMGQHRVKYRSIMFNLKDSKNPDFRRKVLLGLVKPEQISNLTPAEMASDDRQAEYQQIKEKALLECERPGTPEATTDQFRCNRCGQRKCTYYQLQTRSADEPMTTFVQCVNCKNNWKFC